MSYTMTSTVIETFQTLGVQVMNKTVTLRTRDSVISFCETYGFEFVNTGDNTFEDGEPFMYLWKNDAEDLEPEMRASIWQGAGVLPTRGTSFVFKLTETSNLWKEWAMQNNITINGNIEGDVVFGDKVAGDKIKGSVINVGYIAPGSMGIAIGDGASSNVNISSTLTNVEQKIWR